MGGAEGEEAVGETNNIYILIICIFPYNSWYNIWIYTPRIKHFKNNMILGSWRHLV